MNDLELRLNREGYAVLEEHLSDAELDRVACSLGKIVQDEPIRLYESARRVHQPERIELHTDPPHVDVIAWRAIVPAEPHVAQQILDLREVLPLLTSEQLRLLEHLIMSYPDPVAGGVRAGPLITRAGGELKFFCIPWYAEPPADQPTAVAWRTFLDALRSRPRQKIHLEPGQVLLLNNRTHLHARDSLPRDSKRCLRRLWIENRAIAGINLSARLRAPRSARLLERW